MIDCSKTENYLNEKARMTNNCLRYTACVKCRRFLQLWRDAKTYMKRKGWLDEKDTDIV